MQITSMFIDEADTITVEAIEALGKQASHTVDALRYSILQAGSNVVYANESPGARSQQVPDTTPVDVYEDEREEEFVICPESGNYASCEFCACAEVHGADECDGGCCAWQSRPCEPIDQEKCEDINEQHDRYHPVTIEPSMPSTTQWGDISPRMAGMAAAELLKRSQSSVLLTKFGQAGPKLPAQSSRKTIKFKRYYKP